MEEFIKQQLYGYVFHYNYNVNKTYAIPRELYTQYWSMDQEEKDETFISGETSQEASSKLIAVLETNYNG